jgi:hypothetical protein
MKERVEIFRVYLKVGIFRKSLITCVSYRIGGSQAEF